MDKPSHSPLNHGVSALMEIFEKRAQKTRTLRSQLLQRHSIVYNGWQPRNGGGRCGRPRILRRGLRVKDGQSRWACRD